MIKYERIYSPKTLREQLQISDQGLLKLKMFKEISRNIIAKLDTRMPIIVGPCSIHDIESALKFAQKLSKLNRQVSDKFFLIMRVHVEKPRTTIGWKGLVYDPYVNGTNDLNHGLRLSRQLFLKITEMGVPIATEFLNPYTYRYFEDLVTWGFIGARTGSSQVHREMVSTMNIPVGFKNLTDGDLSTPINSIIASRNAQTYLNIDDEGKAAVVSSTGNPHTHLVLRGSDTHENYDKENLLLAITQQNNSGIHSPVLVDCAHGNSKKDLVRQREVFREVIAYVLEDVQNILGVSLESNLTEGNQNCEFGSDISPSLSITDPCIGWNDTKRLILEAYNTLSQDRPLLTVS